MERFIYGWVLLFYMTGEKILVVDDEPRMLNSTRRILTAEDYGVITAENAGTALEILAEHNKDIGVVLADCKMPGMDGVGLLKEVQRLYPDKERLLTSGNMKYNPAQLKAEGLIRDFIEKPADMDTLISCVEKAFEQYRQNQQK